MSPRSLAFVLLAALAVTRLAGLDARQPHHDEAVHGAFTDRLLQGRYAADPVFHGPLLYHAEAAAFAALGRGMWQARFVPALAGIASLFLVVALAWREEGARAARVLGVLVVASPVLLYYTRFNAHDTLILLVTVGIAWGRALLDERRPGAAALVIVLAAVGWSTKLNVLFPVGALLAFPLLYRVAGGRLEWAVRRGELAWAASLGLVIIGALHVTTFVTHLAEMPAYAAFVTTMRAAFVDGLAHWTTIHGQQRLPGPFHYYGLLIGVYEPLAAAASAWAVMSWMRDSRLRAMRRVTWCVAAGIVLSAIAWLSGGAVERVLHVTPMHLVVLPFCLGAAWWTFTACVRRGATSRAWWLWLAVSQTLLYGVAGEKVPWLAVHVLMPWLVVTAWTLADWLATATSPARQRVRVAVVAAGTLYMVWGAVAVTTFNRSNVGEPLVQLEYGPDLHALLARIPAVCAAETVRPCLVLGIDARHFVEWYMGPLFGAVSLELADQRPETPIVLTLPPPDAVPAASDPTHVTRRLTLYQWGTWVEAIHRRRVGEIAGFFAFRERLGVRRTIRCRVTVRADLAPQLGLASSSGVPDR